MLLSDNIHPGEPYHCLGMWLNVDPSILKTGYLLRLVENYPQSVVTLQPVQHGEGVIGLQGQLEPVQVTCYYAFRLKSNIFFVTIHHDAQCNSYFSK